MTLFKDEKLQLERNYESVLPKLLTVIGIGLMLLGGFGGLAVLEEADDPSLLVIGLLFGGVVLILGKCLKEKSRFCVAVTTKRVIQEGPFNRFVSLPLNHITSVQVNGNQLQVATAGKSISVSIPDSMRVCNVIVGLTNGLQPEAEPQQPMSAPSTKPASAPASKPATPAPVKQSALKKPIVSDGEIAAFLGKKWCSGCGEVLPEGTMVCPECGSKYLGVITKTNVKNVLKNMATSQEGASASSKKKQPVPNQCPVCDCELVPFELGEKKMCPECGRTFG